MSNLREAAEAALEALEEACEIVGAAWAWRDEKGKPSITALRAALAEPEQEPVVDCPRCGHCCPQRKPLTDEEIISAAKQTHSAEPGREGYILPILFARAIEAAHGIGEKHE